MGRRQQVAAPESLVDVEFLDTAHALQHRKAPKRHLGCARHVLQEERQIFPTERPQNVPEPLDFLVRGLIRRVLGVVLNTQTHRHTHAQCPRGETAAGQSDNAGMLSYCIFKKGQFNGHLTHIKQTGDLHCISKHDIVTVP